MLKHCATTAAAAMHRVRACARVGGNRDASALVCSIAAAAAISTVMQRMRAAASATTVCAPVARRLTSTRLVSRGDGVSVHACCRQLRTARPSPQMLAFVHTVMRRHVYWRCDDDRRAVLRPHALVAAQRRVGGSAAGERAQLTDTEVIAACKWHSAVLTERLGFAATYKPDEEQLKRHFTILAKHYHPDTTDVSASSGAEAFRSIKEAYDILSREAKTGKTSREREGAQTVDAPHFADEAWRRAQMRLLGDSVALFMFTTLLLIYVVVRHNKVRLSMSYVSHFVGILVLMQVFPRILAAAIVFAWQTYYLMLHEQAAAQANSVLLVERSDRHVDVKLLGLSETVQEHVVVQVDVVTRCDAAAAQSHTTHAPARTPTAAAAAVATRAEASQPHATASMTTTTTLTMDPGVTAFVLPLPSQAAGQHTVYHIRAVDPTRRYTVLDKMFELATA